MATPLRNPAFGESLPKNEEAERAVLAAVILDPYTLPSISARLVTEDFFSDRHRFIYKAMLELQEESTTVDLRTLQGRLELRRQLKDVGGMAYITSLDLDLPDLSRVDLYVQLVKEVSIRRRLIQGSHETIRDCLDSGQEARVVLGRAEEMIMALGSEAIQGGFVSVGEVTAEVLADLEEREGAAFGGVSTGFVDLDQLTHGLQPGNLIIIAGRPGMGKTSFALNIAHHAAVKKRHTVGVFSLEMSKDELALRLLLGEADVPSWRIKRAMMSNDHWTRLIEAKRVLADAPIFIDDSPNPTLLEISSRVRRLKFEHGISLVIVDYLQLMHTGGQYENRALEVAALSRGLKQLAKELDIPVIALSQLSRQPESRSDHRPQLADLRESGAIEQDADLVMFVFREAAYQSKREREKADYDGPATDIAEIIIGKHRNGPTGTVELVFIGDTTSFRNLDRSHGHEPAGAN